MANEYLKRLKQDPEKYAKFLRKKKEANERYRRSKGMVPMTKMSDEERKARAKLADAKWRSKKVKTPRVKKEKPVKVPRVRVKLTDEERKAKRREEAKQWKLANPEKAKEQRMRWRKAHPEKVREARVRMITKKRLSDGAVPPRSVKTLPAEDVDKIMTPKYLHMLFVCLPWAKEWHETNGRVIPESIREIANRLDWSEALELLRCIRPNEWLVVKGTALVWSSGDEHVNFGFNGRMGDVWSVVDCLIPELPAWKDEIPLGARRYFGRNEMNVIGVDLRRVRTKKGSNARFPNGFNEAALSKILRECGVVVRNQWSPNRQSVWFEVGRHFWVIPVGERSSSVPRLKKITEEIVDTLKGIVDAGTVGRSKRDWSVYDDTTMTLEESMDEVNRMLRFYPTQAMGRQVLPDVFTPDDSDELRATALHVVNACYRAHEGYEYCHDALRAYVARDWSNLVAREVYVRLFRHWANIGILDHKRVQLMADMLRDYPNES